ncbi:CHC2 zinc finger domain-containing protein [Verrucomicrobia bacterium]|nr:CHC2 zinc finger domain-containing protein [Verrucomicrobiota bacterium]
MTMGAYQRMTLAEAKALIDIPTMWRHYGFDGVPSKSCRSPFRDDRNPSFSISKDGGLWHDFGTGEGGDVITFIEKASAVSNRDGCRILLELCGGGFIPISRNIAKPKRIHVQDGIPLPCLETSPKYFLKLAKLRNVSPEAVGFCVNRGLLFFSKWKSQPAWLITDRTRINSQVRRLDGKPWKQVKAKAWTIKGSKALWPIGVEEAIPYPNILLVEGGPDLLAAAHFICCENREEDTAIIAILGATHSIPGEALVHLAGKRVRIYGHNDTSGSAAVTRWANQLIRVGAEVDAVTFQGLRTTDGNPVNDLNDLCYVHADDFEREENIRNLVP